MRVWVKNSYPKWGPGKRTHGLQPAVPCWFNFDPYVFEMGTRPFSLRELITTNPKWKLSTQDPRRVGGGGSGCSHSILAHQASSEDSWVCVGTRDPSAESKSTPDIKMVVIPEPCFKNLEGGSYFWLGLSLNLHLPGF